ncbi:hypothetical protein L9F63_025995, partial [Diploptera punctata]
MSPFQFGQVPNFPILPVTAGVPPRIYPLQLQQRMEEMLRRSMDTHSMLRAMPPRDSLFRDYSQQPPVAPPPPLDQYGMHHHQPPLLTPQQPTEYSCSEEVPMPGPSAVILPPAAPMVSSPLQAPDVDLVAAPLPEIEAEVVVHSLPGAVGMETLQQHVHHYHRPGHMHHLTMSIAVTMAAGSPRPQELVLPPELAHHMTARHEDYMHVVEQHRLPVFTQMNTGTVKDTIEQCTLLHKYKQ